MDWKTLASSIRASTSSSYPIIAADNFVSLFIWKDLNITNLEDLAKSYFDSNNDNKRTSPLKFFSYETLTSYDMKRIASMILNSQRQLSSNSRRPRNNNLVFQQHETIDFNNPNRHSNIWTFKQIIIAGKNTACLLGSVFENFDILMETPQVFAERIRVARNHIQKRKQSSDYLNMNDFDIIPLFPLNFWIYNSSANSTTTPTNFNLEDELSNLLLSDLVANTTLQNLTCTHSIVHDSRVIERMHGVMDFTPKQLSWSFQFMNLTFNPSYNYTFLYRVLQKYQTDYSTLNGNVTLSTSQIDTLLWPSSCHYCLTTGCTAENWRYNDSLDFVIFCLGFVFYTCLFVTRAFKSPVIYRKYGIVFVGPVLIMGTYLSMVNAFNNTCLELGVMFTVYLAMLLNTIYLFTILRYFYLRSLYEIVKRVKYPRFFKFLASDTVGFVVTLILPIPLCLIFVTPVAVIFPNYESIPYNTAINITIALSCGLSCIAGVVFVSYEMVKNRKAILKFGFLRFLIFEDPFYFRVDLISMAVVLILLILLAVIFLIEPKIIVILRFVVGLMLYMICGGTSMIMLTIEQFKNMKKGQTKEYKTTLLDEYIEMLIQDKNKDLSQLFRLYCEKSLALENVLLMDTLVHMKRKSTSIPIEALKEIQEQFLAPFSTYEVNVPMKVKRSIIDAMDDASKKNLQKVNTEILNEIMVETEYNLRSTFMRFQKTNEFMQWEEIYQLQKDQSALT